MTSKAACMGNPFDPDGVGTIVGLSGRAEVNIGGPLKKCGLACGRLKGLCSTQEAFKLWRMERLCGPQLLWQ